MFQNSTNYTNYTNLDKRKNNILKYGVCSSIILQEKILNK